jgi:hypothetical protein
MVMPLYLQSFGTFDPATFKLTFKQEVFINQSAEFFRLEHTAELRGKYMHVDRVLTLTLIFKAPLPEKSLFKLAFSGIYGKYNIRLRIKFS